MNILCFTKQSPLTAGGAERRTWECARRWAAAGHTVRVMAGRTSATERVGPTVVEGVTIQLLATAPGRFLGHGQVSFLASRGAAYLRSAIDWPKGHWDVVRDDVSPLPSWYPRAARARGIPSIQVIHNLPESLGAWLRTYGPLGMIGALGETGIARGYLSADVTLAVTAELARRLELRGLPSVSFSANGVDPDRFSVDRAPSSGPFRLLHVGRFGPSPKGQADLIRALRIIHRTGLPFVATFAGDGPELDEAKALARDLGVEGACRFLGEVASEEMPALYAEHDVFVLSSHFEGMPLTLLEAMASGCAVVSSRLPTLTPVLEHFESIDFAPGDVGGLADALEIVASSGRLSVMQESAKGAARARFTWEQTAASELDAMRLAIESLHGNG